MLSFRTVVVAASSILGALAVPQRGGGGGGGLSYTQNWGDGTAKYNFKSSGDGFSVTWSGDKGNFVVGRGWGTGSAK
jgi:endo-1,4-beta-xylanase